jgi:hypothetical protein
MRPTRFALVAFAVVMAAVATPAAASALLGLPLFAVEHLPISEHTSMIALGAGLVTLGRIVRRRG